MTLDVADSLVTDAGWLFEIGAGAEPREVDGLVLVEGFAAETYSPEVVGAVERARKYGAHSVFFEAGRHGRAPVAQAFIFIADGATDDAAFALLHKRLWSWGGVPLLYRASPGRVDLFRCAHEPDFLGPSGIPVCRPICTLEIGAAIAADDAWWDAGRLRNGTLWDDPAACRLMLSPNGSAHRKLVDTVRDLHATLARENLLDVALRRRLLILALLIAYLEEREAFEPDYFGTFLPGAAHFFEVLRDGPALVKLLKALEERFNGNVFTLDERQQELLASSQQLGRYARLVEGYEDASGQLSFWRLYSFRDLPVELISNIYQLFVKDAASSVYTPPALVRLILDEALSWDRIDAMMASDAVILDPACGSGVFLVEAYKRLVLHWRSRHGWARPGVDELRALLSRVHGVDLEQGAVELAAFSLCLALCDALEPEEIRSSVKLFPLLAGVTLHKSCFFEAKTRGLIGAPVAAVVGNPPFASSLTTPGALRAHASYVAEHGRLADRQLAYLFLHEAMSLLAEDGLIGMIAPSGFLYNHHALPFRRNFFSTWRVREILDFVSVRGLFKKGGADPKIVVVVAEASKPAGEPVLHAVLRRSGRAAAEQGFDVDYYDLHWLSAGDATNNPHVWRANLMGGPRVLKLVERLSTLPTIGDVVRDRRWEVGEGYIAGRQGSSGDSTHLTGKPLLETAALSSEGLDVTGISVVPEGPIIRPRTAARFTPPLLLVKEHEDLHHALWEKDFLAYKHEILGISAPRADAPALRAVDAWLDREGVALRAYVASTSPRLFNQRATAILADDILGLPYTPEAGLDLSDNEQIVVEDIVQFQRDYIRLGAKSKLMAVPTAAELDAFDASLIAQLRTVYRNPPLRALPAYRWPGAVCRAFVIGDGEVDWTGADALRGKLDVLLGEVRGSGVEMTRVARLYEGRFIFLLKPDRLRFWTRSIALRDADDILADLRAQDA
ncbi:MAG: methylase [Phenylobacterium sp.]|uniref:HsdM family class I SAM-dependent methyltransferase n=1 Tax=Phenylobacterium sp. TaxID=1871053 RepID=UPI002620E273|nr:N-6 DNA methylase [Phenylobacterium sp.]MDB5499245.1 methylase [Phenylobacterium sp.]